MCSCSSTPIQQQGNSQPLSNGVTPAAQNLDLDSAIRNGADYITSISPVKAKMAVLNIQAQTTILSDYITDHIVMYLINEKKFIVVERSDLGVLQKEQEYQASGEVSDQSAVSIGHQRGVQIIISGVLAHSGDLYVLQLKTLDVESAEVLGMRVYQIQPDTLLALSAPQAADSPPAVKTEEQKEPAPPPAGPPKAAEPPKTPSPTVINGDLNIINNNTTTINGDVYVNTPKGFEW